MKRPLEGPQGPRHPQRAQCGGDGGQGRQCGAALRGQSQGGRACALESWDERREEREGGLGAAGCVGARLPVVDERGEREKKGDYLETLEELVSGPGAGGRQQEPGGGSLLTVSPAALSWCGNKSNWRGNSAGTTH